MIQRGNEAAIAGEVGDDRGVDGHGSHSFDSRRGSGDRSRVPRGRSCQPRSSPDLRPERRIRLGRFAPGRIGRQRGASHAHALNLTPVRNLRREDRREFLARALDQPAMQGLASIDHGEEGNEHQIAPALGRDEVAQLLEHPHGERAGKQWNDHEVRRAQHILREQRDTRRAVEKQRGVVGRQRPAHLQQPLCGPLAFAQVDIEVAI